MTSSNPLIQTVHAQLSITDTSQNVETAVEGLSSPTSMIFLDNNNILVVEKDGQVRHVANGTLQQEAVLQVLPHIVKEDYLVLLPQTVVAVVVQGNWFI